MEISPLAGKPADPSMLINVPGWDRLLYGAPDPSCPHSASCLEPRAIGGDGEQRTGVLKRGPRMIASEWTMTHDSRLMSLPPFPPDYRASGLLLHVTSLPSPYGIGDVGPAAV